MRTLLLTSQRRSAARYHSRTTLSVLSNMVRQSMSTKGRVETENGGVTQTVSISFSSFSASHTTATSTSTSTSTMPSTVSTSSSTNTNSKKKKIIYGLRHAHSLANQRMAESGHYHWGAPNYREDLSLRDAALSDKGHAQVQALAQRFALALKQDEDDNKYHHHDQDDDNGNNNNGDIALEQELLDQVELVVVSPLTRCLQTWHYGCRPAFSQRQQQSQQEKEKSPQSQIPVVAHPDAAERVYTVSEIGRPISQLRQEFPGIDWSLCYDNNNGNNNNNNKDEDDAGWGWYQVPPGQVPPPEWRPHGQGQEYAVPGEPMEVFAARMQRLQDWLLHERSETCILVVCHWAVLRYLTPHGMQVRNCQVVRWELGDEENEAQQQQHRTELENDDNAPASTTMNSNL